jgi:hypothetical protein
MQRPGEVLDARLVRNADQRACDFVHAKTT